MRSYTIYNIKLCSCELHKKINSYWKYIQSISYFHNIEPACLLEVEAFYCVYAIIYITETKDDIEYILVWGYLPWNYAKSNIFYH